MLSGPKFIPSNPVKKVLITLHGYGADGNDLFELGKQIIPSLKKEEVAIYSPNAPEGFEMGPSFGYQWFGLPDLASLTLEKGVHKAMPLLIEYIDSIIKEHKISYDDIILLGFSQGCMMSLTTLYYIPIKAVIGISGMWIKPYSPNIKKPTTKVFLIHGTHDMVVPYPSLAYAQNMLSCDNIETETLSVPGMGHGIESKSIKACSEFLQKIL